MTKTFVMKISFSSKYRTGNPDERRTHCQDSSSDRRKGPSQINEEEKEEMPSSTRFL